MDCIALLVMQLHRLAQKHEAMKMFPLNKHYLSIYDAYFSNVRNKVKSVLEIGVKRGGSLRMWQEYFPNAVIHGIDIEPNCKVHESGNIKVYIGDQSDIDFLSKFHDIGPFDIIIDDGGHKMDQQIISFEFLIDCVKTDGFYVIEDLRTSYIPRYGGGLKKEGTMVEKIKDIIDDINGFSYPYNLISLHLYPSLAFFLKKPVAPSIKFL